jgi:hypothetical protein
MKNNKGNIEVDFFFDPKPLTKMEKKMISDFIKVDKVKNLRHRKLKDAIKLQSL